MVSVGTVDGVRHTTTLHRLVTQFVHIDVQLLQLDMDLGAEAPAEPRINQTSEI